MGLLLVIVGLWFWLAGLVVLALGPLVVSASVSTLSGSLVVRSIVLGVAVCPGFSINLAIGTLLGLTLLATDGGEVVVVG